MHRSLNGALAASLLTVSTVQPGIAAPEQCWFYLHSKLKGITVENCLQRAEGALDTQGFTTERNTTSDGLVSYIRSQTVDLKADVLCYEVNGQRGKVLAFITVAGARACPVAQGVFDTISTGKAPLTSD